MDKVTVLLCNYNHHEYIEEAVRSIVNQTYPNLEILLIDDGSDVDPYDIVSRMDLKGRTIRYLKNEENKGKWFCLNKGVEAADSRWYMIQDADDFAYPWKLNVQMKSVKETNTLLNLAGYTAIQADQQHLTPNHPDMNNTKVILGQEIMNCATTSMTHTAINHNYTGSYDLHNGASLFNRAFHEVGFRFNPPHMGLRIILSEDSDYNLRSTLQFGKTSWTPLSCYSYRLGTGHQMEHQ
jgi:hypothetical protein